MTLAIFFGCTFIAFGPVFSLFLFTIARDPLRIIVLIAGAFFWLVSLLLSSLIWFITVKASDPRDEPLQKGLLIFGVMFSVLLQEAFRFLYYKLLSGWRGLWAHERHLLHDQSPGRRIRAWHHRHPRGLTALLPDLRSAEWSQPSAGILRSRGMFLSPAAPALPSILVARAAITFSAISFLLDWWTLASSGRTGAGVWLQQPADRCGWSWLTLPPLWEPPENSSVLGDLALLALLRVEPQLACLGRMLPWTAGGLSPKKPITSPSAAEDVLSPVPGQGETRASSLPQGEGSGFAKCCWALGWG
ncbi:uncharacterized protein LOC126035327 isoform X5 [Accipiter gentilis]|uniref:uncharacterized protein LOC126035327 isoform X5 n=1 Tax=Astur gentilis TaxID=8957 RepID=UPI002110901A|nr:uncharacterized protein LOC126035327 isoform X5 [Accipiter gentilis]